MGGSVLGEGQWVWGVHEVQETDQCTEIWLESDSQQKIHTLVVTDYQQSERKPYIYIASYGLVSHIVAWFITSSVAHYCGSLFPVSGEWSRGRVQEFLIGKVQTLTERTKSVCCCCCWVFFPQQIISQPNLPLSLLTVPSQMLLIFNMGSCRCETFFLLKTHKSGHCGVTRSIASPPVLVITSRRWPSFPDIKLVPGHTPGWRQEMSGLKKNSTQWPGQGLKKTLTTRRPLCFINLFI